MISYRELLTFDPSWFEANATKWHQLFVDLEGRAADVRSNAASLAGHWTGPGADAARKVFTKHQQNYTEMADVVRRVPSVFTELSSSFTKLQRQLADAVRAATAGGCQVAEDGTVTGNLAVGDGHAVPAGYQRNINSVVDQARRVDAEAVATLRHLSAGNRGFGPSEGSISASIAIPAEGTAPAQVRDWWDGLDPQQQESLLDTDPTRIGQLDGLPSDIRDQANRTVLAKQKAELIDRQKQLGALGNRRTPQQNDQLNDVNGKLAGIGAIEQRLNNATPGYLLNFDTNGPGHAVVATSNPDTAANVVTYVPGMGSKLAGIGGDLDRSDRMVQSARAAGSPSTSAITWLGYNAPPEPLDGGSLHLDVASADDANAGGAKLDQFQDGLAVTNPDSHTTVLGHSYGTTTIGHAALNGELNADDVVFVASPGVGTNHVSDLHLTGVPQDQVAQHVHSTVAQHDIIHLVQEPASWDIWPFDRPVGVYHGLTTHGIDPTNAQFGGTTFTSNPGQASSYPSGYNLAVHSQYWDGGNPALVNMGRIIAGKPTF